MVCNSLFWLVEFCVSSLFVCEGRSKPRTEFRARWMDWMVFFAVFSSFLSGDAYLSVSYNVFVCVFRKRDCVSDLIV